MSAISSSKMLSSDVRTGGETATKVQNSLQLERLQFSPSISADSLRTAVSMPFYFTRYRLKFLRGKRSISQWWPYEGDMSQLTPVMSPNRLAVALQSTPPSPLPPFSPNERNLAQPWAVQTWVPSKAHANDGGVSSEFSFRKTSLAHPVFCALRRPFTALTLPRKQLPGVCWGMGTRFSGSRAPRDQRCVLCCSRWQD